MIGIDTNVLIRYLVIDDKIQYEKAGNLINSCIEKKEFIFINDIVLCETVWVLESGYKFPKERIIYILKEIILTTEFSFKNREILWIAITEYEKSGADFSDILIGNLNRLAGCETSYTFDRKASLGENFSCII